MLLAVDIGNSNIVLGFYANESWTKVLRIATDTEQDKDYYYRVLKMMMLEEGIVYTDVNLVVQSSVVPALGKPVADVLRAIFQFDPIIVGPATYPLLKLDIENPDEIGTDLVANAVAAFHLYRTDCIVVDFGTALTFTTISKEGKILGVSIAPGLWTAVKALFGNTAQLPEVPLELPESVIGRNTIQAIQNGILQGYIGLVRHLIEAIQKELGRPCTVLATGGLSSILYPLEKDFQEVLPNLTLDGLRIIGSYVKKGR